MCGIVAVVSRPAQRPSPSVADIRTRLARAEEALGPGADPLTTMAGAAAALEELDAVLRGTPGLQLLLARPEVAGELEAGCGRLEAVVDRLERDIDAEVGVVGTRAVEARNAALIRLKDVVWALGRDRLGLARAVADLGGTAPGPAAVEALASVQVALSALDRLEVRGRDSAGLHLLVRGHGLDLGAPEVAALLEGRGDDPLFTSGAVRVADGHLSLVYKAAAEVGELGDNTSALRRAVREDELLRLALRAPGARVTVLGHTRWASVGIVSEANAHPLNHEEEGAGPAPYVTVAVNGDVDNHIELRREEHLAIPVEVTCDTKVVPALVSRRLAAGAAPVEAFRHAVGALDGSMAIAASVAAEPGRLLLAVRGSGQSLHIGVAEDAFVVASEPYGVVAETNRYLRVDGETLVGPFRTRGQVVVVDGDEPGVAGISRSTYDGVALPVDEAELVTAEVTTRDIDRGRFPHYLLKELTEAPRSLARTLRGRIVGRGGGLAVALDDDVLPEGVRKALAAGTLDRVVVVGQGTAAVAARSVAAAVAGACARSPLRVEAALATELSGFGLDDDMSGTLVVAVSQSGTTTDTNRTVDLARGRGASVIAIVNRRNSDLVDKADGVLFTSDGRDVEMSVASTKAFYAQVAAGFLLAEGLAQVLGCSDRPRASGLLDGLRRLPEALEAVLAQRPALAAAAAHAPPQRSWAVVGNGPNRIAAEEVRIKLSELCYKSIACDATEDKKHIDLSSEPLVFVCAAGLDGATADDVAKEVAIYRAHRAVPLVVASAGQEFAGAVATVTVPVVHPALAFVLSAMAGHLFGYEAALAIDAQARLLREARAVVDDALAGAGDAALLERLRPRLAPVAGRILGRLRSGDFDGHLRPAMALELASLLRYAIGTAPLDTFELDHGRRGLPSVVVEELVNALTRSIDELSRPIDAIKHQAKTVTVGISRSEEVLLRAPLVEAVLDAGAGRDQVGYRALRTLAALGPAVAEVVGHTHYRIDGDVEQGQARLYVRAKGGIATGLVSRAEGDPVLRGTKHRVATTREVTMAVGASDGRSVVIVPESRDNRSVGLVLLHVRAAGVLSAPEARAVLEGYQGRYDALVDAVTETEPAFDDEVLGTVPIVELLTQPVHLLAQHWR
ncbi:MAG TPA: SIS domain-containing protein [Acidimicrobiales bacterium]|nr:SIS domain-containing protein [Acidimicrobiales bacterium]